MRCLMVMVSALTLLLIGAQPALADGSQPLPGYTINNPPLAPLVIEGQPSTVLQGVHEHAAYDIEVPPRWNGELVMWAHGFRGDTRVLTVDPPGYGLRQRLLEQGFAWAASSYYANDYDVRAGTLSTRALAEHFRRTVGMPSRTFITGVSMGGHITVRSIEQYPGMYDAALPMCGVLGDQELFDYFLDFHLVAQDLADLPAYPIPADYQTAIVPQLKQRVGDQFRAIVVNASGGDRPGAPAAYAYWRDFLFGLAAPDSGGSLAENPGRVGTNLDSVYAPASPVDVNASVQRVAPADPVARRSHHLSQVPLVTGRIKMPVLSLHNLGDLFVPFSMEQYYQADVARHGRTDLLVQRAIRTVGHCEFSPAEVGTAWDDLVAWQRTGVQPAGDDVITPSVVAAPGYGCRFSDQTVQTGTRQLFPPC